MFFYSYSESNLYYSLFFRFHNRLYYLSSYRVDNFWILFTSSLWTLYFGLELQWMLLTIFIIIGSSVWRGLLNYLMLNGILSIWLIIGILLSNSLFFIFGCFGKVGYFPSFLVLGYQYYSSSYLWMVFDPMNKWAYFGSFISIIHLSISLFMNFGYWFVLVNFLIIIFFVKFVLSIKHLILISSLQLFLFILCGLYFEDELFSFSFLLFYSITTIYILWDCLWLDRINDLSIFFSIYSSLRHIPFFLTDLSNLKQFIIICSLLLIVFSFEILNSSIQLFIFMVLSFEYLMIFLIEVKCHIEVSQ